MKRRSFLKHTAHSLAVPGLLGSLSHQSMGASLDRLLRMAQENERVLVLIYLEGGNDGLNTIVPLASMSGLSKVRPHVIMPESRLLSVPESGFGFHPSLQGFHSLYKENRLQVIHSVGYPDQNFSHFRSTDIWMSASESSELVSTGWTGRYLESKHPQFPIDYPNEQFPHPLAVEVGHGASMLFQGEKIGLSMVINDPTNFYELLESTPGAVPNNEIGDKISFIRLIAQQSQRYGRVVKEAAEKIRQQKEYPDTQIAHQLKIISRMIAGGLQTPLYLVRLGSFDTHDNQVEAGDHTQGNHAYLLKMLDEAIMAFMQDQEYLGTEDRVMGLTFSEFGRRIVSNASMGTDHGTAAPMFAFGNFSKGGVLGTPPEVNGTEVYRDNLPIQHDFRQVYSSVLEQWLGAETNELDAATLAREFEQVPMVKGVVTSADLPTAQKPMLYPNPCQSHFTLRLPPQGAVEVALYNMQGKRLSVLYAGNVSGEPWEKVIDVRSLTPGRYIVKGAGAKGQFVLHLVKV